MTPLIVKASKPRNPLVASARFRQAGQHGGREGSARREGREALKRELSTLDLPRHVRREPPSL